MIAGVADSSEKSAKRRGKGKPFEKGVSGNPGGRPKSLLSFIREHTEDGEELVRLELEIARGKLLVAGEPPTVDERQRALTELFNRGWGKPRESVDLGAGEGGALSVVINRIVRGADAD